VLSEAGIIKQAPVEADRRRLSYHLTTKGTALKPLLGAMSDWGLQWLDGTVAARN